MNDKFIGNGAWDKPFLRLAILRKDLSALVAKVKSVGIVKVVNLHL